MDLCAVACGESRKGTDLVLNVVFCFVKGKEHFPTAEAKKVGIAGVCSNGDSPFSSHSDYIVHYHGISGMPTAGYIGCSHILEDLCVISKFVCAKALADVAVKIYVIHIFSSLKRVFQAESTPR